MIVLYGGLFGFCAWATAYYIHHERWGYALAGLIGASCWVLMYLREP